MAGSYYDAFLIDELDSDASAMVEPYAYEVFIPAELSGSSAGSPPAVTILSPPPGGPIGPTEPFVFTVTCAEEIAMQRFNLRTGGPGSAWEVQYRDGTTGPGATVTRTAITDGYRFEARPARRWAGAQLDFEPTFGTALAVAAMNT